jgi:hypothetical protein
MCPVTCLVVERRSRRSVQNFHQALSSLASSLIPLSLAPPQPPQYPTTEFWDKSNSRSRDTWLPGAVVWTPLSIVKWSPLPTQAYDHAKRPEIRKPWQALLASHTGIVWKLFIVLTQTYHKENHNRHGRSFGFEACDLPGA